MTRLEDKHPRKPTWFHYLCNECGFRFWSQVALDAPSRENRHKCGDCRTADTHFTSGSSTGNPQSDRNYHGGEFTKGEW